MIYVVQSFLKDIWAYPVHGTNQLPVRSVSLPSSAACTDVTVHGTDLYVLDFNQRKVLVYHERANTPYRVMDDAIGAPTGIAVDHLGNVYVANEYDNAGGSQVQGEVRKYAPGDNFGSSIGDANLFYLSSVTVDAAGDVFADGFNISSSGEVDELAARSSTWQNTGIVPTNGHPTGMRIDSHQNLVLDDVSSATFETFTIPGFAKLSAFKSPCSANGTACINFAIARDGSELWTADMHAGLVYGISYPSGHVIDVISNGLAPTLVPTGVAVSPNSRS